MSEFDAIPDELKERDQWLMWDAAADTPRRPHWRGDFGISWNDPNDWHSFEEAVDAASEKESWGIGYVFAYSNEDYPRGLYGAIDVDDCLDDGGSPKSWMPDMTPFIDAGAYIERSPSGHGLHVPLVGFEPPEWWQDSHFSDGEHEGVEAYGSKFFTFTGDAIEPSGSQVAEDVDVSGWLLEAYEIINGEPPTLADESGASDTPDTDLNITIYDVISSAKYPEEENRSHPFHPSGTGQNFRVDEGAATFRCWRHQITGNAAHLLGIEQGIITCGGWENGLDSDTWREIFDAARDDGYDIPGGGRSKPKKEADGGVATASQTATTSHGGSEELRPRRVVARAGYDAEETELSDIKASEAAFAIDRILQQHPEWHFLVVNDDTEDTYTYHDSDGIWRNDGERRLKKVCRKALQSENKRKAHGETVYAVQGNPNYSIDRDDLGAPAGTVATPGGLLDLLKRETRPVRPEDTALNRIVTRYDPAADYEGTRWIEFIRETVDPSDLKKLQEYAGYCLWHHAQPHGKALFLVGPTDSGKGTFLKAISQVIGEEYISHESLYDLLQTRWGAARLFGKMANIRNEVTPGGLKNIQKFKELTGGEDMLSAENKGQDKFDFRVTQKFMFATNQMPDVENTDGAFFNRCLFVSFPNTVPRDEQDTDLLDTLESERREILSWMLEGLDRLMRNSEFSDERSELAKDIMLKQHGDSIDRFVHSVLEVTGDSDDVVHKKDLYQLYTRFCDYHRREPEVQQTFTSKLKGNEGVDDGRSRRVDGEPKKPHVYNGIRVSERACNELQAEIPRHFYADGDDGDDMSDQSRLG